MTNHPNRGGKRPGFTPEPAEIIAAREAAGLTKDEAAALVYVVLRTWQQWETAERKMHPAFWELFKLKLEAAARDKVLDSITSFPTGASGPTR